MSRNYKLGTSWPPRGWEGLSFIKNLTAQAVVKDSVSSTISGLAYEIEPIPVYQNNNVRNYIYHFSIYGWQYSIQDKSQEYKVLSFYLRARRFKFLPTAHFLSDIKVKSCPFLLNEASARRTYRAAIFLIKKIENGQVPDYKRILKSYKIHPTQRGFYEINDAGKEKLKFNSIAYDQNQKIGGKKLK